MDYFKLNEAIRPKRVLDIGAHVGDFTSTLSKLSPECEFVIDDILDYQKLSNGSIFQLDILFRNSYIY